MNLAALARILDQIVELLAPLPPHERLLLLREAEARLASRDKHRVRVENGKLVYEPVVGRGDARVKKYGPRAPRLSIPKWAYEAIGSPTFVRVRIEGSRIVMEPA